MAREKSVDYLRTWEALGFSFSEGDGAEVDSKTYNPFTGKDGKMYVNSSTGQWIAYGQVEKRGNVHTFVNEFFNHCLENTKLEHLAALADEKELPIQAFQGEIAWSSLTNTYLIPFRNLNGEVRNLQAYKIGGKCFNVKGLKTQLWNTQEIKKKPSQIIWICEGAWDGIALKWAFKSTLQKDIVIALQGGNPYGFKDEFIPLMSKRRVYVAYDNDNAGYQGEEKVYNLIHRVTAELRFLAWPDLFKDKYDIRDFINEHGGVPSYPRAALGNCVNTLRTLMDKQTKKQRIRDKGKLLEPEKGLKIPSREEVESLYMKWLKMKDAKPLAVMFGTVFANRLSERDPIWMFMVAPPAGMKTELISKLTKSPRITTVNKLTPAGMISGISFQSGEDPSILLEADGKTLVVTDFTTIIDGNRVVRDEIFSHLRDAYDGLVEKQYAKFKKSIKCNFGIIAATTPIIDSATSMQASLGERFLKYRLEKNPSELDEEERMYKAMANIGGEGEMDTELKDLCYRFLEKPMPEKLPTYSEIHQRKLMNLAKFTARVRAQLLEDQYTGETLVTPFAEFGTRLVKQFMKFGMGVSIYFDEVDEVQEQTIEIIKEVAADTCPQMTVDIVRSIYVNNHLTKDCMMKDLLRDTGLSNTTLQRRTERLVLLKIIKTLNPAKFSTTQHFEMTDPMQLIIENSGIFDADVKAKNPSAKFVLRKTG